MSNLGSLGVTKGWRVEGDVQARAELVKALVLHQFAFSANPQWDAVYISEEGSLNDFNIFWNTVRQTMPAGTYDRLVISVLVPSPPRNRRGGV